MATKLANALEERSLVERLPCADDKRVVRLGITREGTRTLERAHPGATPGWPASSPTSPTTSASPSPSR